MALGALIDAGAPLEEVVSLLNRLDLPGWELRAEPVLRGGIGGTKARVWTTDTTVVRTATHIQDLISQADLPPRVQDRARSVFTALAEAEGRLHRRPPDQVHFHEVGGVDAIIDVVGTCAALELLDVDEVVCSPVAVGLGMVRAAHGIIPNPAPAVVELLRGAPTHGVDLAVELTTPTGAALMVGLSGSWGPLPAMTVTATGFGAGSRELDDRPNLTQVVLGDQHRPAPTSGQPQLLIEANLDDVTGEVLAHTMAALLEAGAADTWTTPVVGKKGRPSHVLSVLCDASLLDHLRQIMTTETGTFGVRAIETVRWPVPRYFEQADLHDRPVRVKVSPGRTKAEFDDAADIARQTGRPVRTVLAEVEALWHEELPAEPVDSTGPDLGHHGHHTHDHTHSHGHSHDHTHSHDHGSGSGGAQGPDQLPPA